MLADLKRAGLKLTPQRIAIVRELADDFTPPDRAGAVRAAPSGVPDDELRHRLQHARRARGMLASRARCASGGAVRFDPNTDPHHHAVCDACGTVVDITRRRRDRRIGARGASSVTGFRVLREERIYRGLCDRCSS